MRKNYTVSEYPEELKSKVYLLKHFERYIMDRLYGDYTYTFEDRNRVKGMDFVQKYLRMKHVIVFKLSHDVLQVSSPATFPIYLSLMGPCSSISTITQKLFFLRKDFSSRISTRTTS